VAQPLQQGESGGTENNWRTLRSLDKTQLAKVKHNDPRLDSFAGEVEKKYELPAGLLVAVKNHGERTNTGQVSEKGAKGTMQFIDSTRAAYPHDVNNPLASIDAAGKYFKDLVKQYNGNVRAAVAHYNGGHVNAKDVIAGKQPRSEETRKYLQRLSAYID
jgi:soluble lytic murein transglycosylase-like protein